MPSFLGNSRTSAPGWSIATWLALLFGLWSQTGVGATAAETPTSGSYTALRAAFREPDLARWGEVPLWWWEGDRLDRERITWQLETLAAHGVKSVCPIQRSPARCDPQSFTPAWWELLEFVIDYFRTQRWFSAPGYDDAGQGTVAQRNYYDTKVAASIARLQKVLAESTPDLEAAQQRWEQQPHWTRLVAAPPPPGGRDATADVADGWIPLEPRGPDDPSIELAFHTDLANVTGLRCEWQPSGGAAGAAGDAPTSGPFRKFQLVASLPDNERFHGSLVRVQMVDTREFLHLAEVQVYSNGRNLAPQGIARQASTHPEAPAARANDGNVDGSWGGQSVSHTLLEQDPWWQVDLGGDQPIDRIVVWNRTDGTLHTRLSRFRVTLVNSAGTVVWERLLTELAAFYRSIAPELEPARRRLARLLRETRSQTP